MFANASKLRQRLLSPYALNILVFFKFRISLELIQEIFLSNILLDGLDKLAEPNTINKLIINIIKSHNEDKNS
jgi:hypothetical protein